MELTGAHGQALAPLTTIFQLMTERCHQAGRRPQPWLGDLLITPAEIAAVLEAE